jgi:homocysteine S-methyltransferase
MASPHLQSFLSELDNQKEEEEGRRRSKKFYLTDGGLETTLIFLEKLNLQCFAAFPLVEKEDGQRILRRYFESYLKLARERDLNFILDTPTWRASPDWGARLGYSHEELIEITKKSVKFCEEIRRDFLLSSSSGSSSSPSIVVLNGVVGPRGDGYNISQKMSIEEAEEYHAFQIGAMKEAGVEIISAITMTYPEEAVGILLAASKHQLPTIISFTLETDGRLPSGHELPDAISLVDTLSSSSPLYFMINCAHPTHFHHPIFTSNPSSSSWLNRIGGLRANASKKSHAELDESLELDIGHPEDLGQHYKQLRDRLPNLLVLGGCCGTDSRHLEAICSSCSLLPTLPVSQ